MVAAVTSQVSSTAHPRSVPIPIGRKTGLDKPSAVVLNHIPSVDRQRLIKRLGSVDAVSLSRIDDALRISLGSEISDLCRRVSALSGSRFFNVPN